MRAYAGVDDLEDELLGSPTPANPDRLIQLASTVVDEMVAGAVYTVNTSGYPTASADVEILRRLTVLQAVYMADDPDGLKAEFTEMTTSTVKVVRPRARSRFAPRAVEYLRANGYPGQRGLVVRS